MSLTPKQQLEEINNPNLLSILSIIQNLPMQGSSFGLYGWNRYTYVDSTKGDFVGYVVSDDFNAYPDGGTYNNYWYERVVQGVLGIDYGSVTLSAETYEVTVNHTLDVIPSFVALVPTTLTLSSGTSSFSINGKVGCYYNSSRADITSVTDTITKTQITFKGYSSSYGFKSGDYYWIAIA